MTIFLTIALAYLYLLILAVMLLDESNKDIMDIAFALFWPVTIPYDLYQTVKDRLEDDQY